MDSQECPTESLCFARRTKRQRLRAKKQGEISKLRKLDTELDKITLEQRELGFAELNPPVQRGWKRMFVVEKAGLNEKEIVFFDTILKKINTIKICHRQDFKKKKRKMGKNIYIDQVQKLSTFYEHGFRRLKLTMQEKSHFRIEQEFSPSRRQFVNIYVFNDPSRFKLQVFPNMITKLKIFDPLLTQREAEINNYIEGNGLRRVLENLVHERSWNHHSWGDYEKPRYKLFRKQKEIQNGLIEYFQNKHNEKQ